MPETAFVNNVQEPLPPQNVTKPKQSRDGGMLGWTMVFASFMTSFIQDGFRYSFGLLLPQVEDHFSVGRAEASLTSSILTFLTLALGPVAALLLPRLGHRATTILGSVLATLGLALAGLYIQLVDSTEANIVVFHATAGGLTGIGFGLKFLPAMDILTYYFSGRLGLALGVGAAGSALGQVVLAPLLSVATSHLGLATTFYCQAGLISSGLLFGLLYRLPKVEGLDGGQAITPTQLTVKDLMKSPTFHIMNLFHLFFHFGIFTVLAFTIDRAEQLGLSADYDLSLLFSIMGVCNCLGRVGFGFLLDRFRHQAILLTTAVTVTNAGIIILSAFLTTFTGQAIFCGIFGATFGSYVSSIVFTLQLLLPDTSSALGLILFSSALASLASPPLVGLLYDLTSSFTSGFVAAGGLAFLAALLPLVLLLPRINKNIG